jgi:hypothetical protein
MLQKLDLHGFQVTADDDSLIMGLANNTRMKFLDLRGHAIPGVIAELLSHLSLFLLGVMVQLFSWLLLLVGIALN